GLSDAVRRRASSSPGGVPQRLADARAKNTWGSRLAKYSLPPHRQVPLRTSPRLGTPVQAGGYGRQWVQRMDWPQWEQMFGASCMTASARSLAPTIGALHADLNRGAVEVSGSGGGPPATSEKMLDRLDQYVDWAGLDQEPIAARFVGETQGVRGVMTGQGDH